MLVCLLADFTSLPTVNDVQVDRDGVGQSISGRGRHRLARIRSGLRQAHRRQGQFERGRGRGIISFEGDSVAKPA